MKGSIKGARVIRLEQNYRSTQNILDAANAVIRNNQGRKGKTLWTENGCGELVTVKTTFNESDEANFVAGADHDRTTAGAATGVTMRCCTVPTPSPTRWNTPASATASPTRSIGGTEVL